MTQQGRKRIGTEEKRYVTFRAKEKPPNFQKKKGGSHAREGLMEGEKKKAREGHISLRRARIVGEE